MLYPFSLFSVYRRNLKLLIEKYLLNYCQYNECMPSLLLCCCEKEMLDRSHIKVQWMGVDGNSTHHFYKHVEDHYIGSCSCFTTMVALLDVAPPPCNPRRGLVRPWPANLVEPWGCFMIIGDFNHEIKDRILSRLHLAVASLAFSFNYIYDADALL